LEIAGGRKVTEEAEALLGLLILSILLFQIEYVSLEARREIAIFSSVFFE